MRLNWLTGLLLLSLSYSSYGSSIQSQSFTLTHHFDRVILSKVIYADDKFVAIGGWITGAQAESGRVQFDPFVAYSPDGVEWARASVNFEAADELLNDIAHGDGVFVAVGFNGTVLTSDDGVEWQRERSGIFDPDRPLGVAFKNSIFVLAGASFSDENSDYSLVYGSRDRGLSWQRISIPTKQTWLYTIKNVNGQFLIGGARGLHITSSDTTQWAVQTSENEKVTETWTMGTYDYAYGNDTYVGVGRIGGHYLDNPPPDTDSAMVARSRDGKGWTQFTLTEVPRLNSVDYVNSEFVAVGRNGAIATSIDGTSWKKLQEVPAIGELSDVAYGAGRYVLVGKMGSIFSSEHVSQIGGHSRLADEPQQNGSPSSQLGSFEINGVMPSQLYGSNCVQSITLKGSGFTDDMRLMVKQKSTGFVKELERHQVNVIDPNTVQIFINTASEASSWDIQATRPGDGKADSGVFEVLLRSLGDSIGSFGGVEAFSNGPRAGTSPANYAEVAPHQCVDYVKRYYSEHFNDILGVEWGSAQHFWDRRMYLNLTRRVNSVSTIAPKAGDLIFFRAGTHGHVALVTRTDVNSVEIIQQNIDRNTAYGRLSMSVDQFGKVTLDRRMGLEYIDDGGNRWKHGCTGDYDVLGWLSRR